MDTKIELKEEDPFSDSQAPQSERDFFPKIVKMKTNSDDVLMDNDAFEVAMKTEMKSETPFCSQKEREYFNQQFKFEAVKCSNKSEIISETKVEVQALHSDLCLQQEREFPSKDPLMKDEYSSDHELDDKMEIKEESWWLQTETSSVSVYKDGDFRSVKSPRLCLEAVSGDGSGKSPLPCIKVSERETTFSHGKYYTECEIQKSDMTELSPVIEQTHSEQSASDKSFRHLSNLESENFIHDTKQSHTCNICDKKFTRKSSLKIHNLIHEGKKAHQCKACDKRFTRLSDLRKHNLNHEGKKPHQCKTCDKRFTRLSDLKRHNLTHEGKLPYKCKTCDKSFTRLSNLKTHNLIHEGKFPYQCKTCDKNFTHISNLKKHNMIHEGKLPYKCKTCGKSFTHLSHLKTHSAIHEGKKPHQCKTCDKRFIRLSDLYRHSLIHEGKKAHLCKTCGRSFMHFSHLKTHNLIHEGKKPHQCKICDKRFTRLSDLKRHNMIHEGK